MMARPAWIVLKFGGTSVSTRERWETIEQVVRKHMADGYIPFVVCSALSGISNMLEKLLREAVRGAHEPILDEIKRRHNELASEMEIDATELLDPYFEELDRMALGASLIREISPRMHARVMAMGELMATTLGAAFFNRKGLPTKWLDARQMLLSLDDPDLNENRRYLSATCGFEPDSALQSQLAAEPVEVFLTQGFIARNSTGETVLLGRGGSDTSGAYFAAKLHAQILEIWTDVPGMFTANPRDIPQARLLRQLGYNEAQELASMGAKVLHPRCLEPVRRYHIPLHIRSTMDPDVEGTVISDDVPDFGAQVKAISSKTGVTLITMDTLGMWQQVGFLSDVFAIFRHHGLSVDMVATSEANVTVSLDPMANALDPASIKSVMKDLSAICHPREVSPCAVVSLVGRNIRSILHEMGPALEVFDEHQIYMVSQAASDLNFSFVVDQEQTDRLVQALHSEFFADRLPDALFGPTWDELFRRDHAPKVGEKAWWRHRRDDLLAIAAEQSPVYVYDEETLRKNVSRVQSIEAVDRVYYSIKANPNPEILKLFYEAGIGFECVSPGEVRHVKSLFPGIDPGRILFTPNFAPRDEYAFGYEAGVHVTLDNLFPLEAWPEVFRGQDLLVRVDPGRGRGHHKYVRTAGAQSKFGVAPSELERLLELAADAGARIVGLHAHVGSGIKVAETWADTAMQLVAYAESMPDVRYLDLGGGLGISERAGVPKLDVKLVSESLSRIKAAHPNFELWLEPGRYMVATAGVLLSRVTQTKQKENVNFVGIDTGMNSLIRPALYGAYHEIVNLSRLDEPVAMAAEVVGPICETGDVLGHARPLPHSESGDVILIATAGAYGRAMSSQYNLREPASERMLKNR